MLENSESEMLALSISAIYHKPDQNLMKNKEVTDVCIVEH